MTPRLPGHRATALTPVELHILLALSENERHGYGIKLDIEKRTGGAVNLASGTLYEAMQRLEDSDLITEAPAPRDERTGGRPRRYYRLEGQGRRALQRELRRLEEIVEFARDKKLLPRIR